MRVTMRMLASVKPGRFLEAGDPTGLTGLLTHPSPRSTLLYLYSATLKKLERFPEHSVYRQSTEALTKHRYNVVASVKPPGYDEWLKRVQEKPLENISSLEVMGEDLYRVIEHPQETDEREIEWDGEEKFPAGSFDPNARSSNVDWESEPPLEASQIVEIENQIGGGLIEEVIQVAEGELKLADTMAETKVWEELEEKAPQGQWEYFSRDQHTPGTQEPPNK